MTTVVDALNTVLEADYGNERRTAARLIVQEMCLCNVGAQACPVHPYNHLKTQDEKIAFRKSWDERVR